jgi:hypothetical protein
VVSLVAGLDGGGAVHPPLRRAFGSASCVGVGLRLCFVHRHRLSVLGLLCVGCCAILLPCNGRVVPG